MSKNLNPLISIIVPVYNMEKYINRCVDSILNQEYKNIEVILVDDGSKDSSPKICDEYAKKDNRIKVFHKENGGQGSARNLGIDNANGEYIGFVDSDDYIDEKMYKTLVNNAIKYNADISCCSGNSKTNDNSIKIFKNEEIMYETLLNHCGTSHVPWDKIFRKELFDGVRYPKMRAYEDCATIYKLQAKAKIEVCQNSHLYYYIYRDNSTMTQPFSKIKFQAIVAYKGMHDFYLENFFQYSNIVKASLLGSIMYCVGETYKRKLKVELKEELKYAKGVAKTIDNKNLNFKQKICLLLIKKATWLFGKGYKWLK